MNLRILFLITMVALTMQGCQGTKNDKAARPTNAPAAKDGDPRQKATDKIGSCENPLSATVQAGEKEIKMDDLVGKSGSYQLISTEYFGAFTNNKGTNVVHFLGKEMPADRNLREEVKAEDKIEVVCSTKEAEGNEVQVHADLNFPNDFDIYDGKVRNFRHDQVHITKDEQKAQSSVFPKELKLTDSPLKAQKGWKTVIVKKDNDEITFKMQFDGAIPQHKRARIAIALTYRLQK